MAARIDARTTERAAPPASAHPGAIDGRYRAGRGGVVRGGGSRRRSTEEMTAEDYRRALEAAVREYEDLGQRRQAIDSRLAEIAQTIGTLSRLCGLVPTVPMGLTDACRLVTRRGDPMTPADVRERLHAIGFDLSKYSNDLAAIHTILKRLNGAGELRFLPRASGKHAYVWNRRPGVAALGPDIAAFMRDSALERAAMRTHDEAPPSLPRTAKAKTPKTTRRAPK